AFQLLGGDPDVLAEAARRLAATGADGIDLNMGCPVSKIVAKGQGAALMRDPLRAAVILRTLRKAVDVPFTIKIRSGWDERTVNAVEIARIAEGEGVDAITVHPRTRSQQYTGRAPWAIIREVVAAVSVPVVGNGDVRNHADASELVTATGCAAVMIGRGALGAPWIFAGEPVDRETRACIIHRHCALIEEHLPPRDAGAPWIFAGEPVDRETRACIIHRHCALIEEHLPPRDAGAPWIFAGEPVDRETRACIIHRHCALIEEHLPPRDALVQLKKHLAWYSTGLAG